MSNVMVAHATFRLPIGLLFLSSAAGCAPAGYHYGTWADGAGAAFTLTANDECRRPEIEQNIVNFLNGKIGQRGGPAARVIAATGLATIENGAIQGPTLTCHGNLQTLGGSIGPGAVAVRLADTRTANGLIAIDAVWETDADRDQREAAARRENAAQFQTLLKQQQAQQDRLARCDPAIKARYDAMISPLSDLSVYYNQHPNQNLQDFLARNDIDRRITQLRAEEAQACSQMR